jgi:leader peptidase (prepilin peptidase)/N-methyltransferase
MISFFTQTQQGVLAALFFVFGAIVGRLANLWAISLTRGSGHATILDGTASNGQGKTVSPTQVSRGTESHVSTSESDASLGRGLGLWTGVIEITTGLLFAGFVAAYVHYHCQELAEVRPDEFWLYGRIFYQLILISLLVAATATDLRAFVIPDQITLPGALVGIAGATFSGQLQMVHLWVDWNQEIPGIVGPYIPEWLDPHRHWHGFAWSLAGGLCGAGLTWLVRFCSSRILGREALGLGDVTFMGLIGTFLGWQPTVFVFLLAPLCGLAMILPLRVFSKRSYVPYGPFLAAGAIFVLFSWKWLWLSSRLVFGDARSLGLLAAGALFAFLVLLVVLRVYSGGAAALRPNGD